MEELVFFAALLVFAYGLVSAVAEKSPITGPMVFVAAGILASPLGFNLFTPRRTRSTARDLYVLLGCIGFMVAAVFSFVPPGTPNDSWMVNATAFTLQGAQCFLLDSLLMLPEGVTSAGQAPKNQG